MKSFKILFASVCILSVSAVAADPVDSLYGGFKKIRFGGYGEMLYQKMDYSADRYSHPEGAMEQKRATISLPRAVFALDYKFDPSWILSTELEFEYGGTGSSLELEYDEGGEYEQEVEKGGEVVLEQLHITKVFSPAVNLRFGHMIVPVGITNSHHEPINYFGTTRPEGEMTIIPCTWHETGLAFLGEYKGFNYQAMVVTGLDPNGFSTEYWVRKGKQGAFEVDNFTSPALAARLEYAGIKNLRLGASAYWGNTAKNRSKQSKATDINGEVTIFSGDVQYKTTNLTVRANYLFGNLSDSRAITKMNFTVPRAAGFPRTPVAESAQSWFVEAGYNVMQLLGYSGKAKLYPFVRYECYDSMNSTEEGVFDDPRYDRELYTAGINYFPLPNLVFKADYSKRKISGGDYNDENTFSASVGYVVWFSSK